MICTPARIHTFDYDVDPQTGCWLWQGSLTWNGYGQGKHEGKGILAHRWYWEQANGPIPKGMQLDHAVCQNRRCCNPDHLEVVTNRENARRGRATKLTREQAAEIKYAPRTRGSRPILAEKYGVSLALIDAIRCGLLWKDVQPEGGAKVE